VEGTALEVEEVLGATDRETDGPPEPELLGAGAEPPAEGAVAGWSAVQAVASSTSARDALRTTERTRRMDRVCP
jgi:hypothetical protein